MPRRRLAARRAAVAALVWPLVDFDEFIYRAADPTVTDLVLGVGAHRCSCSRRRGAPSGWCCRSRPLGFLVYAFFGPLLDLVGLGVVAHRGYGLDRIVGTLYMTLEGIFGVPLDVAATYIILFTIFGAVLERSGAGRFFLDWSRAAIGQSRSGAAAGRAVTLAGCLLGTVSGSGVATTVMLGSVAWPMLQPRRLPAETRRAPSCRRRASARILCAAGAWAPRRSSSRSS